jgi:hypothetical protein
MASKLLAVKNTASGSAMTAALIRGSGIGSSAGNSFLKTWRQIPGGDSRQNSVALAQSGLAPIRTSPV